MVVSTVAKLTPIEGWGFSEPFDGLLADAFQIDVIASGVSLAEDVIGWKARALDGKYAGALIELCPRNSPCSGTVTITVPAPVTDARPLFSGLADSEGLEKTWA